jgi:hypothetical protein
MTLAGIYNDQSEELPHDVFSEMMGRLSQSGYPHQLILTPNPPDPNHWLAREFPEDNHLMGRRYYSAPIHANAHNLPQDTIDGLIAAYPPSHPKHRSAVLGLRGLNVIGKPVYGGDPEGGLQPSFSRALHVRPLACNPQLPLLSVIDFGKHHPAMIFAQYTSWNQLHLLGGVMGQDLFLEDFAPIALRYRASWFPEVPYHMEACDPAGAHDNSQGVRQNGIEVLKSLGFHARYKENSNAPDVRLAMVERLAGLMRKRTPQGEAFGVEANPDRWLLVSQDTAKAWPFLADGFEAGYVWDEHYVSVGSKQVRKPKKDGWYEHGQNCLHGDTLVVTDRGSIPIRDLTGPVRVLSRAGAWVSGTARQTRMHTPMVRLAFADGTTVVCTPDHRFLTPQGWCAAVSLPGQTCYNGVWQAQATALGLLSLKARSSVVLARITSVWGNASIGRCGSPSMVRSPQGMTSTIGTTMEMTTDWRTWHAFHASLISATTVSRRKASARHAMSLSPVAHGTGRLTGWRGIDGITNEILVRSGLRGSSAIALNAEPVSRPLAVKAIPPASSVARTAGRRIGKRVVWTVKNALAWCVAALSWRIAMCLRGRVGGYVKTNYLVECVSVEPSGRADAYCLDVPATHAFCIESGLVTHNCVEYLELNFGGAQPTRQQVIRASESQSRTELRRAQRDLDPHDLSMRRLRAGRGGY